VQTERSRARLSPWAKHSLVRVDIGVSPARCGSTGDKASQFDLYADISAARQQIAFAPMSLDQSMKVYADELRA